MATKPDALFSGARVTVSEDTFELREEQTMKSGIAIIAVLLVSVIPAAAEQNARTTTVTTARGGTISRTRSHAGHQASASTVVTTAAGKTATASTVVDADRSDGRVGVLQTATGPDGRTASRARSTSRQDGAIVHDASRTGFDGRTASKQGVYTRDGRSHTRTGRAGRTHSWSRSR
jgi:hypothetical protein